MTDCVKSFAKANVIDRVDGADRGDKFGLVDFAHDAGFLDCGVLSCGLESCGCT